MGGEDIFHDFIVDLRFEFSRLVIVHWYFNNFGYFYLHNCIIDTEFKNCVIMT